MTSVDSERPGNSPVNYFQRRTQTEREKEELAHLSERSAVKPKAMGYARIALLQVLKGSSRGNGMSIPQGFDYVALFDGRSSRAELAAVFDEVEADLTYIDDADRIVYFSPFRIFTRSEGLIGQSVYDCHTEKSLPSLHQMLDDFRSGTRVKVSYDSVVDGRAVHTCYIAMYGKDGSYRGCLESATYRD